MRRTRLSAASCSLFLRVLRAPARCRVQRSVPAQVGSAYKQHTCRSQGLLDFINSNIHTRAGIRSIWFPHRPEISSCGALRKCAGNSFFLRKFCATRKISAALLFSRIETDRVIADVHLLHSHSRELSSRFAIARDSSPAASSSSSNDQWHRQISLRRHHTDGRTRSESPY